MAMPLLMGSIDRASDLDGRLLAAHNRERAAVGAPPLAWDAGLAADARAWASELARTKGFRHSHAEGQGENLWMGTTGYFSPEQMVGGWAAERAAYRPGIFPAVARGGDWSRVGHYTQMIWRNTRRVGCAVAGNGGNEVLVCRYAAPGNVFGERPI